MLIVIGKNESQPHFAESARALLIWLIMWEVIDAARRGRVPSLAHVRDLLTEPVEMATDADGNEYEIKGLRATAGRAVACGDPRITGLAGRFVGKSKEIDGIISTADTQTRWLMSAPMREDISVAEGADFSRLTPRDDHLLCRHAGARAGGQSLAQAGRRHCPQYDLRTGRLGRAWRAHHAERICRARQRRRIDAITACARRKGRAMASSWPRSCFRTSISSVPSTVGTVRKPSSACQAPRFAFAPNDGETAEWMSRRSGDRRYAGLSASDDPAGATDARMSYGEKRERLIPPDAMYGIPPFHGLVWFAGRAAPQPVFAPPYWEIPELRGRYAPDPYHRR